MDSGLSWAWVRDLEGRKFTYASTLQRRSCDVSNPASRSGFRLKFLSWWLRLADVL
jgi:hypothetical protein